MSWDNTTLFVDDNPADRAFRQEVRDWVADNLPADLCNRPFRIDPPELKPWHRKLYERGWIAPHWPKDVGGMGATLTQQIILFEEISRVGAPTPYPHGLNFIGPLIIDAGAEGAAPAADPHRRDDVVPGLFGERRRLRPRQPRHPCRARRR
ncbi:MAG: acyl-CoA dehydrogenase family protein [Xanthobacteraceae bacterium]